MKPDLDITGMHLHEEKHVKSDDGSNYTIICVFTGWIYRFNSYAVFVPEG